MASTPGIIIVPPDPEIPPTTPYPPSTLPINLPGPPPSTIPIPPPTTVPFPPPPSTLPMKPGPIKPPPQTVGPDIPIRPVPDKQPNNRPIPSARAIPEIETEEDEGNFWWVTYEDVLTANIFEAIVMTSPTVFFPVQEFFDAINSVANAAAQPFQGVDISNEDFKHNFPKAGVTNVDSRNFSQDNISELQDPVTIPNRFYRVVDYIRVESPQSDNLISGLNSAGIDGLTIVYTPINQLSV